MSCRSIYKRMYVIGAPNVHRVSRFDHQGIALLVAGILPLLLANAFIDLGARQFFQQATALPGVALLFLVSITAFSVLAWLERLPQQQRYPQRRQ